MRKISLLLFIPLLFVLSCKKSELPFDLVVEELDTSEAFKNVIFSNFKKTSSFLFNEQSDINYLGFITDSKSVVDGLFNPFIGVRLSNTRFSLTDVEGKIIKENDLNKAVLSEYRTAINNMRKNTNQSFLPKINYEIYASSGIVNSSKTNITLVLNTVYYYLNLNGVTDNHFVLSPGVNIDEIKANGAYLSRIGYGQQHTLEISSDEDPKKVLTYLKAYLSDLLHNDGKKAEELSKDFEIPGIDFNVVGGNLDFELIYSSNNKEKIKQIIKMASEPRAINMPFGSIEFEFKHFNKVE